MRAGRRGCGGGASSAQAGPQRRTANIQLMAVTLEVSRLSGWLNADAFCHVEREHTKRARCRVGVWGARGAMWGASNACKGGASWRVEAGTRGGAL